MDYPFKSSVNTRHTKVDGISHEFTRLYQDEGPTYPPAPGPAPLASRVTSFLTGSRLFQALCILLHALLVFMHISILIIGASRMEHRVVVPLGSTSNFYSSLLVQLSQVFSTVYTAGLVFLTQQLAVSRNLLLRQKLTSAHDKTSAWNGLGSAVVAVWRQYSIPTAVSGTIAIATYLACISALHITTPAILRLVPFNSTRGISVGTSISVPNNSQYFNALFDLLWEEHSKAIPFLERIHGMEKLGLENGTLYGVLEDNGGIGNVTVNAITFNVTCGYVRNGHANDSTFNVGDLKIPTAIAPNTVKIMHERVATSTILMTSINFTDSRGDVGSTFQLLPPIKPDAVGRVSQETADASEVHSLQFIGCHVSTFNHSMTVDAISKLPTQPPPQKTTSEWQQWLPGGDAATLPGFLSRWRDMLLMASRSAYPSTLCSNATQCDTLSVVDQFLAQNLGLFPDLDPVNAPTTRPNLALHQLENALASVTAAGFWTMININRSQLIRPDGSHNSPEWTRTTTVQALSGGDAVVTYISLLTHLNVNFTPALVGLATSVVLLVLAGCLVRVPDGKTPPVDAIGMLQTIWLLHAHPEIRSQIFGVKVPTIENLRAAGMFDIQLANVENKPSSDHEE